MSYTSMYLWAFNRCKLRSIKGGCAGKRITIPVWVDGELRLFRFESPRVVAMFDYKSLSELERKIIGERLKKIGY